MLFCPKLQQMSTFVDRITELEAQVTYLANELKRYDDDRLNFENDCAKFENESPSETEVSEDPMQKVLQIQWHAIISGPLNAVVQMGIPRELCRRGGPMTAQQLAQATGHKADLIVRLMRPLTAVGMFDEPAPLTYSPRPETHALASPTFESLAVYMSDVVGKINARVPEFALDPQKGNAAGQGLFQYGLGTNLPFFEYLKQKPRVHSAFNEFMHHHRFYRPNWYDCYSIDEVFGLGSAKDSAAPLFVDVAGGNGHEATEIQKRSSHLSGRFYLQDLPETIKANEDLSPSVIPLNHDIFTPQTLNGSRVYYLRSILHDWPDDTCVRILKNLAPALKKGYSKILIADYIVPDTDTPMDLACMDICMMMMLGGAERTAAQWRSIVAEAGLRVERIWEFGEHDGLIEVVSK